MKHLRFNVVTLGAACLAILSGCVTRQYAEQEAVWEGRTENTPLRAAADTTESHEDSVSLREPIGLLTLPDALALALTASPELAPFAWQNRVNEAHILQARLRRNPVLSLGVEDVLGTGVFSGGNRAQTTLRLSQVIELGGKRAERMGVASQARGIARSEYELKRVDVLADVTQRFIQVVGNQHALDLTLSNRQLAEDALQTVRARVKAGKGLALEESKAQVALARGALMVETAEHELNAARSKLAASWSNTEPVFERAQADLFALLPVPPIEELLRRIPSSPKIVRWISERNLRKAEIKLADALRVPNMILDAGVRRLETLGTETLVFGLSMPLQLFDRNQGGSAEARALLGRTEAKQKAAEYRLRTLLLGLYEEVVHDIHIMEGLENGILPKAEDALAISRESYTKGISSYLEVLDAQRTIFDVRQEHIRTAISYHQLLVEIERLLGQPFDGDEARR